MYVCMYGIIYLNNNEFQIVLSEQSVSHDNAILWIISPQRQNYQLHRDEFELNTRAHLTYSSKEK